VKRSAILLAMVLLLAGCGARKPLVPVKGQPLPLKPYGAATAPTSDELLKPAIQTRPARSDDLLQSSEQRRSDEFDLPPD
jgi:hypothetical protein